MNHLTIEKPLGAGSASTFTRASTANLPDGSAVSSGVPRCYGGKLLVEDGTTNVLAQNLYSATGYSTAIPQPYALYGYGWFYTLPVEANILGQVGPLSLSPNTDYTLTFRAAASQAITLEVDLYPDTLPQSPGFSVSQTPRDFEWTFNSGSSGDLASCMLRFYGNSNFPAGMSIVISDLQLEAHPYATSWHIETRADEGVVLPLNMLSQQGSIEMRLTIPDHERDADLIVGDPGIFQGRVWLPFASAGAPVVKLYTSERGELNYTLPAEALDTEIVLTFTWDAVEGKRRIILNGTLAAEDAMNGTEAFAPGATSLALCSRLNGWVSEVRFSSVARSLNECVAAVVGPFDLDASTAALFTVVDGVGALTCYHTGTVAIPSPQYPMQREEVLLQDVGRDSAGGYYLCNRGAHRLVLHSPEWILTAAKYASVESFVRTHSKGLRHKFAWVNHARYGRTVRLATPSIKPSNISGGRVRIGLELVEELAR